MHHAPSTRAGATKPSTNAVRFGSGERIENRLERGIVSQIWPRMNADERGSDLRSSAVNLLSCEYHLDVRATVLLTSGFSTVLGDWIARTAPNRLEPRRRNVGKVLDDVVLLRLCTLLRERQVDGLRAGGVSVSLDTQDRAAERRHRLAKLVEQQIRARHDLVRSRRELNLDLLVKNGNVFV